MKILQIQVGASHAPSAPGWEPSNKTVFTLNTHGSTITGLVSNIGNASNNTHEMWDVREGLTLARSKGINMIHLKLILRLFSTYYTGGRRRIKPT